jgi:hypothetical protein
VYLLGDFSSQMPKQARGLGPETLLKLLISSVMVKAYHQCSNQPGQLSQKTQLKA